MKTCVCIKKRKRFGFFVFFFVFLLYISFVISFCAVDGYAASKTGKTGKKGKGLTISNVSDGYKLYVKKSVTLRVRRTARGIRKKDLVYRSSNKRILRVTRRGKVTALKKGSAYITVYNRRNKKQRVRVGIIARIRSRKNQNKKSKKSSSGSAGRSSVIPVKTPAKSVEIDCPIRYPYLAVGAAVRLTAEVYPHRASQGLRWSSSNTKVVTVDQTGLVTACGKGTAKIQAAATDGSGVMAVCTLTVPSFDKGRQQQIAHRGYSGIAPENTRAAFQLAAAQPGFTAIECDVYRTTDGVWVISHDSSLKRIFGVDRRVYECSYEEIKDLTATGGNGAGNYPSQDLHPCRLEEFLSILKNCGKRAVIELKRTDSQDHMDQLFALISSYGMNDRVDIISFSSDALVTMAASIDRYYRDHPECSGPEPELYFLTMAPDTAEGTLGNQTPAQWALSRGFNLSSYHPALSEEAFRLMHQAGKKVTVWTVNDFGLACHYYYYDMGVDAVTSNELLFNI